MTVGPGPPGIEAGLQMQSPETLCADYRAISHRGLRQGGMIARRSNDAANAKHQTLRPAQGRAVAIGRRVLQETRVN
jgi:hypothetical protein